MPQFAQARPQDQAEFRLEIGLCADELFCMAGGASRPDQQVMKMTQIIWYRNQTAPASGEQAQVQCVVVGVDGYQSYWPINNNKVKISYTPRPWRWRWVRLVSDEARATLSQAVVRELGVVFPDG